MSSSPMAVSTWVIVVSLEHARRGVAGGFIMANHGKRGPLARMNAGDRILIYSPNTALRNGQPLQAITVAGMVTGSEPEPSPLIPGGFRLAAVLREIDPIPLAAVREHLPTSRFRFGWFELDPESADAIFTLVDS